MFDSCGLICLSISNHGRVTNLKLTPFLNVGLGPTYPARAFLFVLVAWLFQHVDLSGKSPAFLQEGCVSNLWGPPKNISICLPSLRMHASRHQDNPLIFLISFSTWWVVRFQTSNELSHCLQGIPDPLKTMTCLTLEVIPL